MLIGLKGYKGAGKDTVADFLVHRYDFRKVAFAAKMKEAIAALMDIDLKEVDDFKNNMGGTLDRVEVIISIGAPLGGLIGERSMGWREFLQRFGTEMGREIFGQDFWVDLLFDQIPLRKVPVTALSYNLEVEGNYVITDARFVNEAERIKSRGGYIVEVIRPGFGAGDHLAETPLPRELIDFEIMNDDDLRTLYQRTEAVLNELRRV